MNNSDSPLFSIIIPVYNRQEGIDCLLNVLATSIAEHNFEKVVELIVIDDYSDKAVVLSNFPFDILLKRNNRNQGAPFSRQRGFELSKGRFIHFHDSDDSVTQSWLFEVLKQLERKPEIDLLMTARVDQDNDSQEYRQQKYFHKQVLHPKKVASRLIYRNCMGPLGGVTFSRRVLQKVAFKNLASCQDWQMYIDAIKYSKVLSSRTDIQFLFNKAGNDRISYHSRKKILGHLQLAKITAKNSIFKNSIRLFYLYTCKQHVFNKSGGILKFYRRKRFAIVISFLVVSIYWRLT
ncbi:MAG: glycosyltransferase family 2 protein [Cocleimonas sp.]